MKRIFESWRRFVNEELDLKDRPTSLEDPRIHYNDGTVVCYTMAGGASYCGNIKDIKPERELIPPLTQDQRDAWLKSQQPPRRREPEDEQYTAHKFLYAAEEALSDDIWEPFGPMDFGEDGIKGYPTPGYYSEEEEEN